MKMQSINLHDGISKFSHARTTSDLSNIEHCTGHFHTSQIAKIIVRIDLRKFFRFTETRRENESQKRLRDKAQTSPDTIIAAI